MTATTTSAPASRAARPAAAAAAAPSSARRGVRRTPTWRAARRRGDALAWGIGVAVVWSVTLALVATWLADGGIQSLLAGGAESVTALGRVTGLAAANLLLVQVLLMARVPVLERAFGRDRIIRGHRLTGFWSFWLMLAHLVLITVGYAAASGMDVLGQFWDLVWNSPGMLLAAVGTLLLVMVVVLSLARLRRRTRYESWHLLHLYAYVGVFLALPHQLWTGADFLASPLATAYWWSAWVAAVAAVLIWRIGVPIVRSLRHDLRVASVEPDGTGAVTITITGRRLDRMRAVAGQFFVWRFLGSPGATRGHPLSLSAAPDGQQLQITASVVGDGTRRMARLRPGTRVLAEGPYGGFVGSRRRGRGLLMIGAGAGIAPLVALLEEQDYADGEATLITREHSAAAGVLAQPIARLVAQRRVHRISLNGPRARSGSRWLPAGQEGVDAVAGLRAAAPRLRERDVFLCGPTAWMREVERDLRAAGVPTERIHHERFAI